MVLPLYVENARVRLLAKPGGLPAPGPCSAQNIIIFSLEYHYFCLTSMRGRV